MDQIYLSKGEVRKFILYKQGLLGDYRFIGKSGVLDFIRQAGCIQFDPIDVCGKNAEIVLQSRISGFTKQMLFELLYTDRKLLDYFDKNLSIIPIENWKYFGRQRESHRNWERSYNEIQQVHDQIIAAISENGPLCSSDLNFSQKVDWYWSKTKLSRAALEHMYFSGELAIHHKEGNIKYYDLIEKCIPEDILNEADPYPCDFKHKKWRVLQRIGSVGLLWNRASDAWLGISGLKANERNNIFTELLSESCIVPIKAENVNDSLYCLTDEGEIKSTTPKWKTMKLLDPIDERRKICANIPCDQIQKALDMRIKQSSSFQWGIISILDGFTFYDATNRVFFRAVLDDNIYHYNNVDYKVIEKDSVLKSIYEDMFTVFRRTKTNQLSCFAFINGLPVDINIKEYKPKNADAFEKTFLPW